MFIGPTLIILNKYILSDLNFPYPIFLSALGVFVTVLVSNLSVNLGFVKLQKKEQVEGRFYYSKILPIGLGQAGTLAFGNVVYLFLNVGTIQMLKSFTPVIIFLTSYMYYNFACFNNNPNGALAEKCDYATLLSLLVISLGTAATCGSTPELSVVGLFMMLMAEFMEVGIYFNSRRILYKI